jgi:hypothetical protein
LKYIQRLEFHLKMKMNHFHLPSVRLWSPIKVEQK